MSPIDRRGRSVNGAWIRPAHRAMADHRRSDEQGQQQRDRDRLPGEQPGEDVLVVDRLAAGDRRECECAGERRGSDERGAALDQRRGEPLLYADERPGAGHARADRQEPTGKLARIEGVEALRGRRADVEAERIADAADVRCEHAPADEQRRRKRQPDQRTPIPRAGDQRQQQVEDAFDRERPDGGDDPEAERGVAVEEQRRRLQHEHVQKDILRARQVPGLGQHERGRGPRPGGRASRRAGCGRSA